MKVKYKISVSSDAEETLKYPYVQIKIEIRNHSRTTIPLIKGIHHPDTCTGQALSKHVNTKCLTARQSPTLPTQLVLLRAYSA